MSCADFGAYHSSTRLTDGTSVAYAVMPRCSGLLDRISVATSHELTEAATDPLPREDPAHITTLARDRGWAQVFHGGEVADMCHWEQDRYRTPEIGPEVVRSWSNAAALIDHDPCVPDDSDRFYFNSAPELPDGNPILQLQVSVPRTLALDLFSTGPTGAWTAASRRRP